MLTSYPVNYPELIVEKSQGLTGTERKLAMLGYQTFLSLWSYPNPYKMQSNGKELCDLLIVFDNHIIIFSDKDCAYNTSGDSQVDWRRWYKRAIQKSAEQLLGAKNWILRHPDKISVDAKCTQKLPLDIEVTPDTIFHLVAVAHGASERCKEYFNGGDGGLLINSDIVGNMHINQDCKPFCIGRILENPQDFIHVFDDTSYCNVLQELDTIQDFIDYLDARKSLFLERTVLAESENDILAQHMKGVIKGNPNALQDISNNHTCICFEGGLFDELLSSSDYLNWRKRMEKSYFWDQLLQKTFFFIENGLSEYTSPPSIQEQSVLFKRMARENRFRRCCLSEGFLDFQATINPNFRGTRVILNTSDSNSCYLLFLLPRKDYMSDESYRAVRRQMLMDYCTILKAEYPEISHIIGVAHESNEGIYTSEDFVYLDATEWSAEMQTEALQLKMEYEEHGLLKNRAMTPQTYFPSHPVMKGRDRNAPCPCGSGKKYKKCCGRYC